jgi:glycosyltransferase involved in cell wall biosynthesis
MHQYFDIDYYLEEGLSHQNFKRPNYLPYVTKVFPASDFDRKSYMKYDAVLYQIGNSEFHLNTIRSSLYLPGYSIFHDTNLTNVFEEVLPQHGFISDDRLLGEQLLDKKIANPKVKYVSSIVNKQQGLITHSLYNAESLEKTRLKQSVPIKRLNLPTATPKLAVSKQSKEIILLGLAGIIHPAKGLNIIEEIAKSDAFYDCKIHIFGLPLVEEAILDTLRAYPNVQIDTDLTDFQFQNMLGQLDILINFRTEYRGETSLATIEAMRFGVVPIVKKIGWYDELPDNAAVKVRTPDDLLKELRLLINDPHRLNAMKQDAKEYIEKNHTYKAYAKGLYDFISQQADSSSNNTQDFIANAIRKGASTSEIKRLLSTS